VFVGVAPEDAVAGYLSGVRHVTVLDFARPVAAHPGSAQPGAPDLAGFWVSSASGTGTQTVHWPIRDGRWQAVAMNADASPGMRVTVDAGVRAPGLAGIAGGILAAGVLLLVIGSATIVIAVHRVSRRTRPPARRTG
jgi:hypothetical protein